MYRQSEKTTAIYCRVDYPGSPEAIQSQIWAARDLYIRIIWSLPSALWTTDILGWLLTVGAPEHGPADHGRRDSDCCCEKPGPADARQLLFQDFAEQVLTPGGVPLYTISDGDSLTENSIAAITGALLRAEKGGLA